MRSRRHYCAARQGIAEFSDECVADPAVISATRQGRGRARYVFPQPSPRRSTITADGKVHRLSTNRGARQRVNPMSDADLEQKLRNAAAAWNPKHDVQPLIDAVWSLDKSADVAALCSLTVPA